MACFGNYILTFIYAFEKSMNLGRWEAIKEEIMCSAVKCIILGPSSCTQKDHVIQALLNDEEEYLIITECASNNYFWGYYINIDY